MTSATTIKRVEKSIWVLIFLGMVVFTLGIATHSRSAATAWSLMVVGGAAVAAGIVLIWLRSRMRVDA